MSRILIVEDNVDIAELEKDYLEINGYDVVVANDGLKAEKYIEGAINGCEKIDLIILDVMIPIINGYDLCRKYREKINIPILMVTAKTESIDKIRGLGLGADDYIVKPFDPAELVARVKSHIDRFNRLTNNQMLSNIEDSVVDADDYVIEVSDLKIMTKSWKVFKNNVEIKLPNREFEILNLLAMNPNIVFSKEHIFEKVWGLDYESDSATVMVHINRIRDKIEDDSKNPKIIETIWGAGYRLNKE